MFSSLRLTVYAFMGVSFASLGLLAITFGNTDFMTFHNGMGWNNIAGIIGALVLFVVALASNPSEIERANDERAHFISLHAFRFAFCLGILIALSTQILAIFFDISLQSLYVALIMSLLAGYFISYVWMSLRHP